MALFSLLYFISPYFWSFPVLFLLLKLIFFSLHFFQINFLLFSPTPSIIFCKFYILILLLFLHFIYSFTILTLSLFTLLFFCLLIFLYFLVISFFVLFLVLFFSFLSGFSSFLIVYLMVFISYLFPFSFCSPFYFCYCQLPFIVLHPPPPHIKDQFPSFYLSLCGSELTSLSSSGLLNISRPPATEFPRWRSPAFLAAVWFIPVITLPC